VRPEGLDKFKKITSSSIEPATFRFVSQCFNHYATACPTNSLFIRFTIWVTTLSPRTFRKTMLFLRDTSLACLELIFFSEDSSQTRIKTINKLYNFQLIHRLAFRWDDGDHCGCNMANVNWTDPKTMQLIPLSFAH
jgi:hypothetical protein